MYNLSRRRLLSGAGAIGSSAFLASCGLSEEAAETGFFASRDLPIGLQLYTLGDEVGQNLEATFDLLASIGFQELEMPSLYGRDAAEIAGFAAASGLSIPSLHVPFTPVFPGQRYSLQSSVEELADVAQALSLKQMVVPFPDVTDGLVIGEGETLSSAMERFLSVQAPDFWRRMAGRMNETGAALAERGIALAYHNHNIEFAPLGDTTPWAVLLEEMDEALVKIQLDIAWVALAGVDPKAELERLNGRVTSLHVKDLAGFDEPQYYFGLDPKEVGSGIIDWEPLLTSAADMGVQHFFMEQEPPFAQPRMDAVKQSYAYLAGL